LASAAVWTRRAGGDDTVSILVTAITNLTCFLVTPFWLYVMTGSELSATDQAQLARMPIRLGFLVVLPMALAQLLRQQPLIGEWATRRKPLLSTIAQVGILSMVLAGATQCGLQLQRTSWGSFSDVPFMCVVALTLHLAVFWLGVRSAAWCGFGRPQTIAIGMSGSQKTLMVGLDIAINYFGGFAVLPMVAYHFLQLTADTVIADRLRSNTD
jgi:sodium/bile acid cotransporter 7